MCTCPECGYCCDYGRECCPDCHSGNADHLGERGGCKRIDPRDIPCRTANRSLPHRRAVLLHHFSQ